MGRRYRLTLWIEMDADEEQAYRAERALGPDDSTRGDLAVRVEEQVAGEGIIAGWWHSVRVR